MDEVDIELWRCPESGRSKTRLSSIDGLEVLLGASSGFNNRDPGDGGSEGERSRGFLPSAGISVVSTVAERPFSEASGEWNDRGNTGEPDKGMEGDEELGKRLSAEGELGSTTLLDRYPTSSSLKVNRRIRCSRGESWKDSKSGDSCSRGSSSPLRVSWS